MQASAAGCCDEQIICPGRQFSSKACAFVRKLGTWQQSVDQACTQAQGVDEGLTFESAFISKAVLQLLCNMADGQEAR